MKTPLSRALAPKVRTILVALLFAAGGPSTSLVASADDEVDRVDPADPADPADPIHLKTVAERSDWRRTSTHAEVVELCNRLVDRSEHIHQEVAGKTFEDRSLPLLVIADPPVKNPEDVGDRLVVFAWGGIHSGEVCGKPATLMLAREFAETDGHPLLKDLVVLFLPLLNADGNDRMSPDNRRGQAGPIEGMGTRPNANGLNINRDFTKMETEEGQAIAHVLNRWDPAVAMDLHTTNGSQHRYTITYDGPRNPACDEAIREFASEAMLPEVSLMMEAETGYRSIIYGNFNRDRTEWRMYPAQPRYSTHYLGLRHHIGILSEAYTYASYKDRVLATRAFVRNCFAYAADNKDVVRALIRGAKERTIARGKQPNDETRISLRRESKLSTEPMNVLGYERNQRNDPGEPRTISVHHDYDTVSTLSVRLPFAYLLPDESRRTIDTLLMHGIVVEALAEPLTIETGRYRVSEVTMGRRAYEGHRIARVEVTSFPMTETTPAGTFVVRTAQPLGSLAAYLLEPQSEDGLHTWNHFDDALVVDTILPLMRIMSATPMNTRPVE